MKHRRSDGAFNPEKFLAAEAKKAAKGWPLGNPLRRFITLNDAFKEKIYQALISRNSNWGRWDFSEMETFLQGELRAVKIRVGRDVFNMLQQDFWEYFAHRMIEKRKSQSEGHDVVD